MAAPPSTRLQNMLQSAVQAVHWTYSLFWQLCPQQGILVWGDGYYNGAIKTRKTVQPMEVSAEEASLQRSQQLRELYESLSAGETNQPARRPSAALSPEDPTESEWFYLMCVSFSFSPGVGLPGKAFARRQHVWLTGANEVDSKVFSRAILAKSARIQVQEDLNLIQHIKTFFIETHHTRPPKPALSEHSTSNPSSSEQPRFHSPSLPVLYAAADPPVNANQEDEEEEEEDEDEERESDSEAETSTNSRAIQNPALLSQGVAAAAQTAVAEPSELMQLEMSEDIRLGSPDDGSNNLDSDFHMLAVNQTENPADQQRRADSYRTESSRRWPIPQDQFINGLQPPPSGVPPFGEPPQEDTHYSQTVATVLQQHSGRWSESSSIGYCVNSTQSTFSRWTSRSDNHLHAAASEGISQWLLKYILFSVPLLHSKYQDENSPKSRDADSSARLRSKGTPQDELSANHVLAERRRREKLNERFIILRSLVPFVTKMDKASILGDTIEYVKQLRRKIQDLEARTRQMEVEWTRPADPPQRTTSSSGMKEQRSGSGVTGGATERGRVVGSGSDRRKLRIVEAGGSPAPAAEETVVGNNVEVSIIESDALLELQCPYREGLLLDIMQTLRELRMETTAVKENVNGKKTSIMEVKRAINQIIPQGLLVLTDANVSPHQREQIEVSENK
ncbi:Transcription factor MYC/MYB N-terminal, partial [Dillenia turbinata]